MALNSFIASMFRGELRNMDEGFMSASSKGMFSKQMTTPPELEKPEMVIGPEGIGRISASIGDKLSVFDTNARLAETMRRRGETNENIIARTGFWFDPDGKPKFEISDAEAELNFNPLSIKAGDSLTAKDVVTHDKLFAIYPELADLKVNFFKDKDPNNQGYIDLTKNEVGLNINNKSFIEEDSNPVDLVTTMLHEMQHALQKREGFDAGGDWRNFIKNKDNFTQKEYEEAFKKYLNIAGELEARNVGYRYSNAKNAANIAKYNKSLGYTAVPQTPNLVRSRNFLQTIGKDPESQKANIDPRAATNFRGQPSPVLSNTLNPDINNPMYANPFERTIE